MRVGSKSGILVAVAAVAVSMSTAAGAGVWRVEQDGSGQFTALQPAVDAAASGDTILIGPGWYQDLNWVDHYGSPIEVCAYWTEDKDLSFIGVGADQVTIGPEVYEGHLDGPQGILQEGQFENAVFVSGVKLRNLFAGATSLGPLQVEDCIFEGGRNGVVAAQGSVCSVKRCRFSVTRNSGDFFSCSSVEVSDCDLSGPVYFGDTPNGVVRGCSATGDGLAYFYRSSGVVEDNEANCVNAPCVAATEGSVVAVRNNLLAGGDSGISATGQGTTVTLSANVIRSAKYQVLRLAGGAVIEGSGNDFMKSDGNDKYLVACYSYPGMEAPIRIALENNYWGDDLGGSYVSAFQIGFFILDFKDDPSLNVEIDFEPFSIESVPAQKKSLGSIKAMFR